MSRYWGLSALSKPIVMHIQGMVTISTVDTHSEEVTSVTHSNQSAPDVSLRLVWPQWQGLGAVIGGDRVTERGRGAAAGRTAQW